MTLRFGIIMVSVALGACLIATVLAIPYIRSHSQSDEGPNCLKSLRQIDGSMHHWAVEYGRTTNDVPTWADLVGTNLYMRAMPICPQGGTYTLGRVADGPKCSIGGAGHTLQ